MTPPIPAVRRSRSLSPARVAARDVSFAGAAAAGQAAALSLLCVTVTVLVAWATSAQTGASAREAVAASLSAWLLAHLTQLTIPGGAFGLAPLGFTAVAGWLLFGAALRAARSCRIKDQVGAAALTGVMAGAYSLIATIVALLARTDAVRPMPVSAFVGAGLLAAVAGGAGALRGAGAEPSLWRRLPARVRVAVPAAAAATGVLLAGGALVVGLALAAHLAKTVELLRSLDAGVTGVVLITLLSIAYVPTAVIWGTSFVLGPGFAVGAGTSVALTGVELAAVPAFPLLAALPGSGAPPAAGYVVLAVPTAAGVVAGLLLERGDRRRTSSWFAGWRQVLAMSGTCGAITGLALLGLAALAAGPGGPGRLAQVGPSAWQVGASAGAWVGLAAAITIFLRRPHLLRAAWRGAVSSRG